MKMNARTLQSACVLVKEAGQPGVQWKWVGTTWFRRLVQKDSCFELGQVRYVLQSPQKCSCVDTARKQKKLIGTVSVRVFDVCATKIHISHEPCVRRHRFCMTTKSPTLNISAFVPSSVRGFEKPGQTRFPCVFVALLRCAHTLTCIFRGLQLHVSTDSCMSKVRSLVLHALCNHGENLSENPSSCTYFKDPRSGVHYSCWRWVPLQLHMHINPGLLDCEDTTPLLRPIFRDHDGGFSLFQL